MSISAKLATAQVPGLWPQHQALLQASGITPAVIAARGYRSVTTQAELRRLGFSANQACVPGLLIPVWGPAGDQPRLYQFRPDTPRIRDGKAIKYETPRGATMALDVPPPARAWLGDPRRPLFVTEGVRKADAAVSRRLCCVALLGVWNWRGTNALGGKTALPEWEFIALNDREVYVAFDSDVMVKREVHTALARLSAFLTHRGARVRFVYLPAAEGGAKVGLDDFLTAGHSVHDVLALATDQLRPPPDAADDAPRGAYTATADGLMWHRPTDQGAVAVPLTNFVARIVADTCLDDGSDEPRRVFTIEASLQGHTRAFAVPAAHFAGLGWAVEHLGAGAIVYPGARVLPHARCAIQALSSPVPERRVYAHLGWRCVGGGGFTCTPGAPSGRTAPSPAWRRCCRMRSCVSACRRPQRVWPAWPPCGPASRCSRSRPRR